MNRVFGIGSAVGQTPSVRSAYDGAPTSCPTADHLRPHEVRTEASRSTSRIRQIGTPATEESVLVPEGGVRASSPEPGRCADVIHAGSGVAALPKLSSDRVEHLLPIEAGRSRHFAQSLTQEIDTATALTTQS